MIKPAEEGRWGRVKRVRRVRGGEGPGLPSAQQASVINAGPFVGAQSAAGPGTIGNPIMPSAPRLTRDRN